MKNLIRAGVVSEVIPERATARVTFQDRDNLVSAELHVLQPSCAKNKFYTLPDVGDNVACLMFPNDPNGSGVILGSFYTDKNPPPAAAQDVSIISFADGTTISYDRAAHALNINCVGNININGERIDLNA